MSKEQQYIITTDGKISGLTNYYGRLTREQAEAYVKYFEGKTREVIGMREAK